jgi:prepilin-type N-terminal cleavage/methylation domain-containing protein
VRNSKAGFTLIEVLIASVIFALSIIALVQTGVTSLRSVSDSEKLFKAVQLAHAKSGEMVSTYQEFINKNGVPENLDEKKEGKFEAPFDSYTWSARLIPSTVVVSKSEFMSLLTRLGFDEDAAESELKKSQLLLGNLNKILKANYAELIVTVDWEQFGRKQSLPVVTHLIPKTPKIEFSPNVEFEEGE